jgi:hypothetical protein
MREGARPRAPQLGYIGGIAKRFYFFCHGLREQRIAGTRSLPAMSPADPLLQARPAHIMLLIFKSKREDPPNRRSPFSASMV